MWDERAVSYQLSAVSSEGGAMQNFRDLKVWHKAHALTLAVYAATSNFPAAERFGLTGQMRRAAASVPANIAEGCVRSSDADFARFLHTAIGSASELEYFVLLARDLKFIAASDHDALTEDIEEIKRMLSALITRLKADS
jgi:four helix bundle protein